MHKNQNCLCFLLLFFSFFLFASAAKQKVRVSEVGLPETFFFPQTHLMNHVIHCVRQHKA